MEELTREAISEELRWKVLKRDGYKCRYCGKDSGPFHLDHVYPFSKGGETSFDNLVTSCAACNLKKRNRVGVWPKPIGYFEEVRPRPIRWKYGIAALGSAWAMMNSFFLIDEQRLAAIVLMVIGLLGSHIVSARILTGRTDDEILEN